VLFAVSVVCSRSFPPPPPANNARRKCTVHLVALSVLPGKAVMHARKLIGLPSRIQLHAERSLTHSALTRTIDTVSNDFDEEREEIPAGGFDPPVFVLLCFFMYKSVLGGGLFCVER